jgi:plastocyanin
MRRLTILLVGAMLVVAGCGGDEEKPAASGGGGGGGENLTVAADKSALKFDKTTLEAKAGKVTITMDNPSDIPHAVAIEGNGVDVDGKTVGKGKKSIASADLKPGTYDFYCPVPGHKAAGMKGKLTVK